MVLAVVPARGGSKGIPGKNLRALAGRPLLAYTAEAIAESRVVDRAILSTDSEEIAAVGREVGLDVPFLRPRRLASDDTPMLPVVQHAVEAVEEDGASPEIVLVVQPTAPLRRGAHLRTAVELLRASGASSVVTVVRIPAHYSPEYAMRIEGDRLVNFLEEGRRVARRQDATPAFSRDGTVYAVRRDVLMQDGDLYGEDCRPLVLEDDESVNLDTPDDWERAERLLRSRRSSA
jgi:CMP-N,N'-diacetyllegionaminic acid synthase